MLLISNESRLIQNVVLRGKQLKTELIKSEKIAILQHVKGAKEPKIDEPKVSDRFQQRWKSIEIDEFEWNKSKIQIIGDKKAGGTAVRNYVQRSCTKIEKNS